MLVPGLLWWFVPGFWHPPCFDLVVGAFGRVALLCFGGSISDVPASYGCGMISRARGQNPRI